VEEAGYEGHLIWVGGETTAQHRQLPVVAEEERRCCGRPVADSKPGGEDRHYGS
jgi:hypothetical protein